MGGARLRSAAAWAGVGAAAIVVALPACVLLVWVAAAATWLLGLLALIRFLLRLWNPRAQAMAEERRQLRKQRVQGQEERKLPPAKGMDMAAAESRFWLVQQYLQDQLDTLSQHFCLHVDASDSLLDSHVGGFRSSAIHGPRP